MIKIVDLHSVTDEQKLETAAVLFSGFSQNFPEAWPTIESAREEIEEALEPENIALIAIDESSGRVLGMIGGIPEYDGHSWELHPLVVDLSIQRSGIGRALLAAFEDAVRQKGGGTIYLGTDDTNNMTSLSQVDLYPDPWPHIAQIKNLKGHPFEFYQKHGYTIVGVIPDANGHRKPDIMMAKRLS